MKDKIISQLVDKYGKFKGNQLISYMEEVLVANEKINLTAVRDKEEFLEKHILDSLTCINYEEFRIAKTVLDMGTGGGFPGIPLAITNPDKKFILVDSLNKRLKVIDKISKKLGIKNIVLVHGRAEDIGHNKQYRENIDCCVSRAVASLDVLSEWCLPLIKKGGFFISYKGENAEEEIGAASNSINILGGKIVKVEKPIINCVSISGHTLVFIKKIKRTPNTYPRKPGLAKKAPIR